MARFKLGGGSRDKDESPKTGLEAKTESASGASSDKPTYDVAKNSTVPSENKPQSSALAPGTSDDKPRYRSNFLYIEGTVEGGGYKVRFITGPPRWINHSTTLSGSNLAFVSERTERWKTELRSHPQYETFVKHPERMLGYFPSLVQVTKKKA